MPDWQRATFDLWKLLDDIDTLDDACKGDDAAFRKRCYEMQRRRFSIVDEPAIDGLYETYATLPNTQKEGT